MASRAAYLSSYVLIFFIVWSLILSNLFPQFHPNNIQREIIFTLPFYLLIVFGCYSLFVIGWNLLIFRECPEAMKELEQNIGQARQNLKSYGFIDERSNN